METSVIDEKLLRRLQLCNDLPTPPTVASKIIELSSQSSSDLDTLAKIVTMDPALSAKILSIANSSMYMRRIEADTIDQAVAMFGWNGTLNIALGFAVMGSVRGALTSGLDYDYFWLRSLAAATSVRALGQMTRCEDVELLFLPGLLQDIGMLALDKSMKNLYHDIAGKQHDHEYLKQLEIQTVNVDHAAVGQWLLSDWGLPDNVTNLVGLSHCENFHASEECIKTQQKCIYLSGYLADCLLISDERKTIDNTGDLMLQHLNVTGKDYVALLGHVAAQFQEMAAIFELKIHNCEQIQSITDLASLVLLNDH